MPTRCPACGAMPGQYDEPREPARDEKIMAWTIDLTLSSAAQGEAPDVVATRLHVIYNALQTLGGVPGLAKG